MQRLRGLFRGAGVTALILLLMRTASALKPSPFTQAPTAAIATINLRGVVGSVRFESLDENRTRVVTTFTGLPSSSSGGLNWHIHRFPVDLTLDTNNRCLNDYVGGHYDPFAARNNPNYTIDCRTTNPLECEVGDLTGKFGQLRNGTVENTDNTTLLDLGGRFGIVGRSIVVHNSDGTNFVCATIRSVKEIEQGAEVVTLSSIFISPVAGTIYIRQVAGENAIIFGKVFWVNLTETTEAHNWHVHLQAPSTGYRLGNCQPEIEGHYDPFNRPPPNDPNYFCTPDRENITNCEVGDLTGKHDTIVVAGRPLPYQQAAFFYTDIFLNLTGENAIEGRSIAIHAPNRTAPIIACAPLVRNEIRYATQFPSPYFQASQSSPHDLTRVTLRNLRSPNIDILPDVLTTYNLCPDSSTPYSPFATNNQLGTPDGFSVGALYQKHAVQLNAGNSFSATELHVYGVSTITSRTLRIRGSNRRTCSAITPPYNINTTVAAIATFNDGILNGTVIFFQETYSNGSLGLTNIITDLRYADPSMQRTEGHNWHIHQLPPVPGQPCQSTIGPHFNPFDVSLNNSNSVSNYTTDCTPLTPLRCESGDLTGKHGQLTIDPPGSDQTTYTSIDPSLYLYGPPSQTIIGRSVGIHRNIPNGPLFSCAEVRRSYLSPVFLTIQRPAQFSRLSMTTNVATDAQVPSQSLLLMHVDDSEVTNCTEMVFNAVGNTTSEAMRMAAQVQSSVCGSYLDDRCMMARDDFMELCNGGIATAAVSLGAIITALLLTVLLQ